MGRPKLLCVDDEPQVLAGLALQLRRICDVVSAGSGAEGLDALAAGGPYAVVISDMRMPMMDGATFLGKVRERSPDTIRVLLTGHADTDSAIAAVNEGQVFRFLTKPCPSLQLRSTVEAAIRQHELVTAERVVLEQTLNGAIKALTDVLSLVSPVAFGRAGRVRDLALAVAGKLPVQDTWQIEVAAMFSQLGTVAVPEATLARHISGQPLEPEEAEMIARTSRLTDDLLANIPRLEPVREILHRATSSNPRTSRPSHGEPLPLAAEILRVVLDFDEAESREGRQKALATIRGRVRTYDPSVVKALCEVTGAEIGPRVRELQMRALAVGMVLAEDLRSSSGLLLVARGYRVTLSFLERARNYAQGYVAEPIRVYDD